MKHMFLAIVDDEPSIREFVSQVIAEVGYAAQEFTDGRDYLDHYHPATAGVILGNRMPLLNGADTLRECGDAR
jgi:FixJ family two-component response regulator